MNSYQLLDSGYFQKLEQIGPYKVVRQAPNAVWKPKLSKKQWQDVDAVFTRKSSGRGDWNILNKKLPEVWPIEVQGIHFNIRLTSFGHLGIFAEQESNWKLLKQVIQDSQIQDFKVLNLFAYTGGSSLACAQAGADVVHLDASKTSNQWAKENANSSGLQEANVRYITDDVVSFVQREIRRGNKYHGVILDPPSFGRGDRKQVWKIEEHLIPLLDQLKQLLEDNFKFILLSSHSPGYTPISLENLLKEIMPKNSKYLSEEMLIHDTTGKSLPSGAYCFAQVTN